MDIQLAGYTLHRQDRTPPQTYAGTTTALSQLYKEISKQDPTHPEAALLVAGDFNAGNLNQFFQISVNMLNVQPEGKKF